MQLLKQGKTKDVYKLSDGNILFRFKDTVTGNADGSADPGGNLVVGEVAGTAANALRVSKYFFELLAAKKVRTHFVSCNVEKREMVVRPAVFFGQGLEFIMRYIAKGSFVKRFGKYVKEGDILSPPVLEVTLKDDERDDPPINRSIALSLGLMSEKQIIIARDMAFEIADIIKKDMAKKGLGLYDIKLEFGIVDGKVALIDEVSAGNMRGFRAKEKLDYEALSAAILA